MLVEEKLQLFREILTDDAAARRRKELAAYRASLKDAFDEHRASVKAAQKVRLAEETARLRREETFRISEERQEARRQMARKEEELSERLFALVAEKLAEVRNSPDYGRYLVRLAREAKEFSEGEEMQILLDAEDLVYFPLVSAAAGVLPKVSPEKLGGGMRVHLPKRRICIENSWNSLFAEAKANYRFEGGPAT